MDEPDVYAERAESVMAQSHKSSLESPIRDRYVQEAQVWATLALAAAVREGTEEREARHRLRRTST